MMDRQHGRIFIECDECGSETAQSDKGEVFRDFWERLKEEGWQSKFIGKDKANQPVFNHSCPGCNK